MPSYLWKSTTYCLSLLSVSVVNNQLWWGIPEEDFFFCQRSEDFLVAQHVPRLKKPSFCPQRCAHFSWRLSALLPCNPFLVGNHRVNICRIPKHWTPAPTKCCHWPDVHCLSWTCSPLTFRPSAMPVLLASAVWKWKSANLNLGSMNYTKDQSFSPPCRHIHLLRCCLW